MKKQALLILLTVLAFALMVALGFVLNQTRVSEDSWYQVSLNRKSVAVALDANPTTGCQWQVEAQGSGVRKTSEKYRSSTTVKNGVVGSGGTWKARFSGFQKGETTLTFRYLQPWVKDVVYEEKKMVLEVGTFGRIKSITVY